MAGPGPHMSELDRSCCCCSAAKSCLTLCISMDCSMPGLLVPHRELPALNLSFAMDKILPVWGRAAKVLGWPKRLFGFFHMMVQQNPNELFGQLNTD